MRIFKTRWFVRFAGRERISDLRLREAVHRVEHGLIDADLGGGVIKQRLARPGQGRSGGYRVLIAYRPEVRSVFLYGFAKSERANIEADELETARDLARAWLDADAAGIAAALIDGLLQEVAGEDEEE